MTGAGIAAIIQARMGSSRLPGKVMMPLAGKPMLARLIERVGRSARVDKVMIATSDQSADDAISDLAVALGVDCLRGDEIDVLGRFVAAAHETGCGTIIRLTGDNPFVDGALLDFMIDAYLSDQPPADYANNIEGTEFPYGLYAEIFPAAVLEIASELGQSPDDREHVTHYFRNRPGEFSRQTIAAPGAFLYDSLTVDTREQYEKVAGLFEKHIALNELFTFRDLLKPSKTFRSRFDIDQGRQWIL
jgi:spore coat polysaccharide biosynthesis protein SpsF